jgi:hypothetical protein
MGWLIRTLAGAFIAGIGWKLGHEAYETVRKAVNKQTDADQERDADEDQDGAPSGPGAVT